MDGSDVEIEITGVERCRVARESAGLAIRSRIFLYVLALNRFSGKISVMSVSLFKHQFVPPSMTSSRKNHFIDCFSYGSPMKAPHISAICTTIFFLEAVRSMLATLFLTKSLRLWFDGMDEKL